MFGLPDDGFTARVDPNPPPALSANEAKPPAPLLLARAPKVDEGVFWNAPNPDEGPDTVGVCPNADGAVPKLADPPNPVDCPNPGDAAAGALGV